MKNYRDLPFALQNLVDAELAAGERIAWVSRPRPRFISPASAGIVLFSVPWTTFAVIWTIGAAIGGKGGGGAAWFPLAGLPFILAGIWMFFSPVWAYRKAQRTVYAITDRRAFVIEKGWVNKINSYSPSELHEVDVREHPNGRGDVIISNSQNRLDPGVEASDEHGFFYIDQPREVEQLLRDLAC